MVRSKGHYSSQDFVDAYLGKMLIKPNYIWWSEDCSNTAVAVKLQIPSGAVELKAHVMLHSSTLIVRILLFESPVVVTSSPSGCNQLVCFQLPPGAHVFPLHQVVDKLLSLCCSIWRQISTAWTVIVTGCWERRHSRLLCTYSLWKKWT